MPVSVRKPGEEGGNRISTVLVDLPVDRADPARGSARVNATMAEIKDSAAVRAGALMVGAAGWAPPLVSSTLARAMSGVRAFNLVVSNVPGPQQPFYLNGQRLLAVHPVVPLNPATQGLNVGILSYDGRSASACWPTATSTRRSTSPRRRCATRSTSCWRRRRPRYEHSPRRPPGRSRRQTRPR